MLTLTYNLRPKDVAYTCRGVYRPANDNKEHLAYGAKQSSHLSAFRLGDAPTTAAYYAGNREASLAVILSEAKNCGLRILAIGGMPDHVHLAVRKPATITEAQIMQRIKGVSSAVTRESIIAPGEIFRWQEHYAVFSFQASMWDDVIEYIQNQKENHAARKLIRSLEETEEEDG